MAHTTAQASYVPAPVMYNHGQECDFVFDDLGYPWVWQHEPGFEQVSPDPCLLGEDVPGEPVRLTYEASQQPAY